MAQIQKRTLKDGTVKWTCRVYVGREANGKRQFIVRSFDREREAKAEGRRLEGQKDKGGLTVPSKRPLAEYLKHWTDNVKAGKIRNRTLDDYRGLLKRYVLEPPKGTIRLGGIPLHKLGSEMFEELYTQLWREQGLSPRTLGYLHHVLRSAFKHAVTKGMLHRNPTDNVSPATLMQDGSTPPRAMRSMDRDQAQRFLEASRGDRYHALWSLLLMGGLRPSEACALYWSDVDFNENKVRVQRALTRRGADGWQVQEPKTDRGRRTVTLPPTTMRSLREWRATQAAERLRLGSEYPQHGFVFTGPFGAPLSLVNLSCRNYRRILEAAGLGHHEGEGRRRKFIPQFRLYDLRHTCASLLLLAGENAKVVSERLGHANIQITLDVYAHVLPDQQQGSADRLELMFGAAC